jgi:DNA polymerase III delta prime subunit
MSDRHWRAALISQCFSPGTPISQRDLFAGRSDQIGRGIDAVFQRGTHAIIFGERGVGKTSLANCLAEFLPGKNPDVEPSFITARVNCTSVSTYHTVWREVFSKVSLTYRVQHVGFGAENGTQLTNLATALPATFGPSEVQHLLSIASRSKGLIVAIDEFDRITDAQTKSLMADTIKALSDHGVDTTVLLVGIGDTVDELIAEHESVARCMRQIAMPRMSGEEVKAVGETGINRFNNLCDDFDLSMNDEALETIVILARGMPHYAHLLAQHACLVAIEREDRLVTRKHVLDGTSRALSGIEQYVLSAYVKAITSSHKNALYRDVLTAAAMTPTDPLGFFAPSDIREHLAGIAKRPVPMGTYMKHLNEFCTGERGDVLQKQGEAWKCRFRFRDPLMQPYVVIRALGEGKLNLSLLLQNEASQTDLPLEPG